IMTTAIGVEKVSGTFSGPAFSIAQRLPGWPEKVPDTFSTASPVSRRLNHGPKRTAPATEPGRSDRTLPTLLRGSSCSIWIRAWLRMGRRRRPLRHQRKNEWATIDWFSLKMKEGFPNFVATCRSGEQQLPSRCPSLSSKRSRARLQTKNLGFFLEFIQFLAFQGGTTAAALFRPLK